MDDLLAAARACRPGFTVLGGGGFVGSHVVRFLRGAGATVEAPARGDDAIFRRPLGHVVYAIGLTADYAKRPFETVEAHVGFLATVLQRCSYASLVYLSSTRLYDGAGEVGREDAPLRVHPANPRHMFDLSKALGEALCLQAGTGARVARLASVYAGDLSGTNFLNAMIRAAAAGPARIDTAPNLARDYIDVDDVARALTAIALRGSRGIYNVASGENVTNAQILEALAAATGFTATATRPPVTDVAPVIDVGRLAGEFGIHPRRLRERLADLVAAAAASPES